METTTSSGDAVNVHDMKETTNSTGDAVNVHEMKEMTNSIDDAVNVHHMMETTNSTDDAVNVHHMTETCVLRKATRMPYHVQPVVGGPHRQARVESKPSAPPTERTEESRPLF